MNNLSIGGVRIPDSKLAQAATELVRDTESDLLFHHSTRVYYFGALAGQRQNLKFDSELLYIGAMFHDMGLTKEYSSATERFEVDGANAARDFLRQHGIDEKSIEIVWDAIALHTTPGIPKHKKPEVALVTAGVDMDVLASVHKSLRLCDLCKELGFDCSDAHTVCEGWFGKLRPTLVWCSCAR
jgi:hypothetical protein